MLDAKEAVNAAANYFSLFYEKEGFSNIRVEEIEKTGDDRYWIVTLGYDDPTIITGIRALQGHPKKRLFKTFKIDADTGGVISMKIREAG